MSEREGTVNVAEQQTDNEAPPITPRPLGERAGVVVPPMTTVSEGKVNSVFLTVLLNLEQI